MLSPNSAAMYVPIAGLSTKLAANVADTCEIKERDQMATSNRAKAQTNPCQAQNIATNTNLPVKAKCFHSSADSTLLHVLEHALAATTHFGQSNDQRLLNLSLPAHMQHFDHPPE